MTLDNLRYALILNNKMLLDRLKPFIHKHDNLPTLNGLGADENEHLLFKGNLVNEQYEVTDDEIEKIVNEVMTELDKTFGDDSGNNNEEDDNPPNIPEPPAPDNPEEPEVTAVTIVTQPQSIAVEHGQTGIITIEAEGTGLTYQWYGLDVSGNGTALGETPTYSGATTNTLSVAVHDNFVELYGENGKSIYCVVTDAYGNTITSNTIIVTVTENEG